MGNARGSIHLITPDYGHDVISAVFRQTAHRDECPSSEALRQLEGLRMGLARLLFQLAPHIHRRQNRPDLREFAAAVAIVRAQPVISSSRARTEDLRSRSRYSRADLPPETDEGPSPIIRQAMKGMLRFSCVRRSARGLNHSARDPKMVTTRHGLHAAHPCHDSGESHEPQASAGHTVHDPRPTGRAAPVNPC